jgi:hypothetical protein
MGVAEVVFGVSVEVLAEFLFRPLLQRLVLSRLWLGNQLSPEREVILRNGAEFNGGTGLIHTSRIYEMSERVRKKKGEPT